MKSIDYRNEGKKRWLLLMLYAVLASVAMAQDGDALWYGFSHPQDSCRTKVWWFHGETATTREGITADLEAFREAGVGGVVYYDQVHGKGEEALDAFSPEWWKMFVFAAEEARRVGLKFETHFSNGYCAGGPWITEELGMQMLVCSDTVIRGGTRFDGRLKAAMPQKKFHGTVAVLAFPVPKTGWERYPMQANRNITVDDGPQIIVTDMGRSVTVRSLSYQVNGRNRTKPRSMNVPGPMQEEYYGMGWKHLPPLGSLEASDDGQHWRHVAMLKPIYSGNTSWRTKIIAFPAATGRYFRLNLHDWALPEEKTLRLGDFTLSSVACMDEWEVKSALVSDFVDGDDTPEYAADETINPKDILDLTPLLSREADEDSHSLSHLRWQAPKGHDWVVLRFDHVATGGQVKHGRKNLMGLECDKLSRRAATVQWENYFKVMLDTLQRHGLSIDGLHIDSHEAGAQNWTEGFEHEFKERRGYDLLRLLPTMAGCVVGSREQTAQTLADVRRTVADLISLHHFGTIDSLCHSVGIPFTAQAVGNGLCIVGDPIQAKGQVTVPQGEFWSHHPDGGYDIKECSSAAHLYGKSIASGEAFTDMRFDMPLSYVKTLADNAYCFGLQEFVVCASAYQPAASFKPGETVINTGGGRHYCLNRMNTCWRDSRAFWDYQARAAFMLRQGSPVVDFCMYLGNDVPVKIRSERLPQWPEGTDFDVFTSDALYGRMSVKEGRIALPNGMSYAAMVVPDKTQLTTRDEEKLADMKRQGATIIRSSFPTLDVTDVDLVHGSMKRQQLWFCHRQTDEADIYFLSNHGTASISDSLLLRTHRCHAEWWNPVDGSRRLLQCQPTADGRVQVPLTMVAKESGFVVLIDAGKVPLDEAVLKAETLSSTPVRHVSLQGWKVFFDPRLGGPGQVEMDCLEDWSKSEDSRIRHYSGTAIYEKTLRLSKRKRLKLHIDGLHDMARVVLNGREVGTLWCAPYVMDLTPYAKKGKNVVRLEVTNTWTNRMILDASLPSDERITHTFPEIYTPSDPLKPSGIDGEVWIEEMKNDI